MYTYNFLFQLKHSLKDRERIGTILAYKPKLKLYPTKIRSIIESGLLTKKCLIVFTMWTSSDRLGDCKKISRGNI